MPGLCDAINGIVSRKASGFFNKTKIYPVISIDAMLTRCLNGTQSTKGLRQGKEMDSITKMQRRAANARAANGRRKRKVVVAEPINPEMVYAFCDIENRFGVGRDTLRKYEKGGMKTRVASHRKWVRGSELIKHLMK
jgi:hypothetical protein